MIKRITLKKLKMASFGAGLLLAISYLNAATYYVDSVNGNNTKNGLTQANAWKTLGKVNALTLSSGDKVLLKRNSVFAQNLIIKNAHGTAAQPIIINSYGTGAKPRINSPVAGGIKVTSCKYIELKNLELNDGGVVLESSGASGVYQNVVLDNLYIHDVDKGRVGITIKELKGAGQGTTFKNITVKNCRIERTEFTGIVADHVTNLDIVNNDFTDIGGPGILPKNSHDVLIRGNDVNRSGSYFKPGVYGRGSGAWVIGCQDVLVEHNEFKNAEGQLDSCGFHIDINNKNIVIQYNLSVNNAGGFAQILAKNVNCTYRYNISINDGWRKKGAFSKNGVKNIAHGRIFNLQGFRIPPHDYEGPYDSYIYNNTIYVKPNTTSYWENRYTIDGLLITNNIFHILGDIKDNVGARKEREPAGVNIKRAIYKNNLYLYSMNVPNLSINDSAMVRGNAGFANPGGLTAEDYIPTNASVVQNKGIIIQRLQNPYNPLNFNLTVTEDYFGNPIVGKPDFGAVEMSGSGPVNVAPVLNAIGNVAMDENTNRTVNVSASDANGDTITLTATGLPNPFGSFTDNGDGTGKIDLTPWYYGSNNSPYTITVTASDGSLSHSQSFTVTVNNVDRAPELDPISNPNPIDENSSGSVNLSASDPDGDSITLTASGLPSFGTLTDNGDGTGEVVFAPWYYGSGTYNITVTATSNTLSDEKSFVLTVNNVNRAPELGPFSNLNIDENSSGSVNLSASDPDGDSISFDASGLPSFGTLTDNGDGTGSITFTPNFSHAGVYTISVTVSDGSLDDSQSFILTVNNVNRKPSISPLSDLELEEGGNDAIVVTASDWDTNDTLTLSATGLPGFGSFTDNGDGSGLLVLAPMEGDAGTYNNITLRVDDGNSTNNVASTTFQLTVTEAALPAIIYSNNFSSGSVADDFTGSIGDFTIADGALSSVNSGAFKVVYLRGSIFPSSTDNFKIVSRMKKGAAVGTGYEGASIRFRDIDADNWYELEIRKNDGFDVRVYGKSSGVATTIGEWDTDLDPTVWNTFALFVSGTDLSVYLDNNLIGTGTLGHSSGFVGLRQRGNDASWDHFRVIENGAVDYIEDFQNPPLQGWNKTPDFQTQDLGGQDIVLKQLSGAWKSATYNATIGVDANYSVAVDGRTTGNRTKSFESPTLFLKYKDVDNWITLYISQASAGDKSLRLKKKIAGVVTVPESVIAANITSLDSVMDWHNIEAQVNGEKLNVWVNGTQEVVDYVDSDINKPVFGPATSCGVRSTTLDVSLEYDNFLFYDEYDQ